MKKLIGLWVATIISMNALEKPATADVDFETKNLEQAVSTLKAEQQLGQRLLGRNPSHIASLATKLKKQLSDLKVKKVKLTQKELTELVDQAIDVATKLESEAYKLK